MPINTAKATANLNRLTMKFDNAVRAARPFYPEVCTIVPSSVATEEYGMLGDVPGVSEWIGDRAFGELRASDFTLKNKKWEWSLRIKKDDIADDRLSMYGPVMEQGAIRAAKHPDKLFFEALVAGKSTAGWDSQFHFDTDHSFGDSGTQSNDLTYDASTTGTVTAAEFKAAFHNAVTTMLAYKDDRGEPFYQPILDAGDVGGFVVVVPSSLWEAAKTGLESSLLGGGDSNIRLANARIVVSPFLTSAVEWYLLKVDEPLRPFVFQAREPISRGMKGMDDLETQDVLFMTQARYNVGSLAWWTSVLTTFT